MADIAMIWHWPPAVMRAMSIEELMEWHALAVERYKLMYGTDK